MKFSDLVIYSMFGVQAVCVEAGMLALRRDALEVVHEDFNEGIIQVQVGLLV